MSRSWRIRLTAVAAALMVASTLTPLARAQVDPVQKIGELAALNEGGILDGAMFVNTESRRAYQVRQFGADFTSELEVFDLDTLEPLTKITLPRLLSSAPASAADPHVAVDEANGRIFLAYLKGLGDPSLAGVIVIDEATGEVTDQPMQPPLGTLGFKVGGMSYSEQDDRLYFLLRNKGQPDPEFALNQSAVSGSGTHRVFLMRWDPAIGRDDVLRPLRSCRALFPNENPSAHYQLPILRSRFEGAVWVPCNNQQGGFQVVRVAIDQIADPAGTEDAFPGPERVRDVIADPASDRLIARYSASLGESWWVFDGQKRSWVGVIGASRTKDRADYAAGIDNVTGRLYLHYPGIGLLFTDARRTPVPQALVFPDIPKGESPMRIIADPSTRRFFIKSTPDRYDVYRDQPPAEPPPPPNPDANTTDIPEEEGETEVSFTAVGQGYGVRSLLIGGAFGIVPPGPGAEDNRPIRALLNRTGTQCGPRDREFAFGVIEKAELGNSVAAVRAQAAKADEATNQDLQTPSRCDIHPDAGPPVGSSFYPGMPSGVASTLDEQAREQLDWGNFFADAECSGNEDPDEGATRFPLGSMTVEVECKQAKERASARAGGPAIETDLVKVTEAFTRSELFRERRRGIVSQVYSVARGIDIAGLVTIEGVETWGEAWANGRAKTGARDDTAATRFVRRITGVKVRNPDGSIAFACEHCARDLLTLQQQVNSALAGRAEIRLPMPDPVLLSGTPGGYQAAVQKDRFQQIADNSLNNDPSREVAGLEVVSLNDSPELRARQVVQLAGVAAGSSYGIFLLDSFDFSSIPSIPDVAGLTVGADVVATADEGTTVFESEQAPPPDLDPPSLAEQVADLPAAVIRQAGYLFRNPVEGALASAVWLALALPLYAFLRRRSLVKSLDEGVER